MEYVFAGLAAVAIGGLAYAVYALRSLPSLAGELIAQGKEQIKAEQRAAAAENDRDTERAGRVKAEAERDIATKRAEAADKALADELGKRGDHAAAEVHADPDALDRVLSENARVSGDDAASAPASTDHGPGGKPAL